MTTPDELKNEVVFKLSTYGDFLLTRDQGEPIREELMRLVHDHRTVVVNLDDVDAYTPSFMDEVLGKSLKAMGSEEFRKTIKLIASSTEIQKLTNLVLSNRSAK